MKTTKSNTLEFYAEIFPAKLTKGQARQLAIVEAAIESYARHGIDKTTQDTIAEICGITRPLIRHYYKDLQEIFDLAVQYVRANFQRVAVEAIQRETDPSRHLPAYIDATFAWTEKYPTHVTFWLLFYYYCGIDPKRKALNSELVSVGHRRITAMLQHMPGATKKHLPGKAKLIQALITGALLSEVTENFPKADRIAFRRNVHDTCKRILTP
jgi:AcrR family transcriptional regulator